MKVGGSCIAWMGILVFWAFAAPLSAEKPLRRGDLRLGYAPLYSKLTGSNFSLGFTAQGGYRWLPWLETHAHVGIAFADNASADLSSKKFRLAIPFGLTANMHPIPLFLKKQTRLDPYLLADVGMVRYSISPTLVTAWEANGALGLGFNIFLSKGFGLFFEYRWGLFLSGKDDFKPTVGWETDLRKGNKGFSSLRTGILFKL